MGRPELTDSDIIHGIKDASDRDKMLHTIFKLCDWQGAAFAFVEAVLGQVLHPLRQWGRFSEGVRENSVYGIIAQREGTPESFHHELVER